jgi:hypothetical protein
MTRDRVTPAILNLPNSPTQYTPDSLLTPEQAACPWRGSSASSRYALFFTAVSTMSAASLLIFTS